MKDFIITKTTVETLGVQAENLKEANTAAQAGAGDTVAINTQINVRPRPEAPVAPQQGVPGPRVAGVTGQPVLPAGAVPR